MLAAPADGSLPAVLNHQALPPQAADPDPGVGQAARLIWTAGGFLPPPSGSPPSGISPLNARLVPHGASTERPQTTSPHIASSLSASRTALPALIQTPNGGASTARLASSEQQIRSSYASLVGSDAPRRPMGMSEERDRKVLERRNHKLQVELQQALNLYGQSIDWMQKQRKAMAEKEQRESEMWQKVRAEHETEKRKWEEELCTTQKAADAKTRAAELERDQLTSKLAELTAAQETVDSEAKRLLAEDREKRRKALHARTVRRVVARRLVAAWNSWNSMCDEKRRRTRMMRAAVNRLSKPILSACYKQWHDSWWQSERQRLILSKDRERGTVETRVTSLITEMHALHEEMELKLAAAEEEKQKALERQRTELMGSLEERLALKEEHEREERVELLRRQIARRIMNQDLVRGWSAWHEMWEVHSHRQRVLRQVASRMMKPALGACFRFWYDDWLTTERETLRLASRNTESALRLKEAEVSNMTALYHAADAERKRLQELISSLDGNVLNANQQYEAKLQQAREERIELLRRQIMRRIMNQGLVRGWTAWHNAFQIKRYRMRALKQATGRLRKPALVSAFSFWMHDWHVNEFNAVREKLMSSGAKREAQLSSERDELRAKVRDLEQDLVQMRRTAEAEVQKALERQRTELMGSLEERLALKEEHEREERVELLRRQIARRIMNQDLVRGWSAWHEMWEVHSHRQRVLRQVASRMMKPAFGACFRFWYDDWLVTMHAKERNSMKRAADEREEALTRERDQLAGELEALRQDSAHRMEQLERAGKLAVERRTIELTGTFEERTKLRAEKEKEKRIEHFAKQIALRMIHREMVRGWTCWFGMWEQRRFLRRLGLRVRNRLVRPSLAARFRVWYVDWQLAMRSKTAADCASLETELYKVRYQFGSLEMEKLAWKDERAALLERLRHVMEESIPELTQAKLEAHRLLDEERGKTQQAQQAREHAEKFGPAFAAAEKARDEALEAMRVQKEGYQEQLQRLLAEQRKTFEAELPTRLSKQQRDLADKLKLAEEKGIAMLESSKAEWEAKLAEVEAHAKRVENDLRAEIARLTEQLAQRPAAKSEPKAPPPRPEPVSRKGVLSNLVIDKDSGTSVSDQIGEALKENGARVMDLFREWDNDGDGEISRKEFAEAMPKLGLDVDKKDMYALFDKWDADGGGTLDFKELQKILRTPGKSSMAAAAKAAAIVTKKK